jgi:hypothetical protein
VSRRGQTARAILFELNWRRVVNGFRTNAPDFAAIITHRVNYTGSDIINKLAT